MATEMEFRDGVRYVPDHIEIILSGIDTRRYTYKEAVAAGNRKMLSDEIYRGQQNVLRSHFNEKEL